MTTTDEQAEANCQAWMGGLPIIGPGSPLAGWVVALKDYEATLDEAERVFRATMHEAGRALDEAFDAACDAGASRDDVAHVAGMYRSHWNLWRV